MDWWDGGEGGKADQSYLPLLMTMQGCDNLKIMAETGCSINFDGAVLNWFLWLSLYRFLHLHLQQAACVFSLQSLHGTWMDGVAIP